MRTYTIVLEPEATGSYMVSVPALPGCFTQGATVEECRERAAEAIVTHIAGLEAGGEPVPKESGPVQVLTVTIGTPNAQYEAGDNEAKGIIVDEADRAQTSAQGFWSYMHRDDEAEGGRITRLKRDVIAEYELLTGSTIEVFLDRDSLNWGDEWLSKVDDALSSVAFFIPVLTPRYFQSAECRRELNYFARRATSLGIKELVLPIVYIDVPGIDDPDVSDEAVALVRSFQYVNWTDLRFAAVESETYRRAVSDLAGRLVAANAKADQVDIVSAVGALESSPSGDELGWLDRVARAEDALPEWAETVLEISDGIEAVGTIMTATAGEIERVIAEGKPTSARLTILRKMSKELDEPANKIRALGNQFASQLHDVDEGMRELINHSPREVEQDEDARSTVCEFFMQIRSMVASADAGLGSLKDMVDSMTPMEAASRDIRPVLRALRQGLTLMIEGRTVLLDWVRLIDASPVQCLQ